MDQNGTVTEAIRAEVPDAVYEGLRVALKVLALRVVRWVTLALAFTLFARVVWTHDVWGTIPAAVFTILINVPLWLRGEK